MWWLNDLFGLGGCADYAELGDGQDGGFVLGSVFCDAVFLLEEILEAVHGV